ncbi:MAG: hypothetical protein R6U52_07545 [Kosmotogaceae bacterium]
MKSLISLSVIVFIMFFLTGCPDTCQTPSYEITVTANPSDGGQVSGGGTFEQGTDVTIVATANENWIFVNWTEENIEVSDNNVYEFQATKDRDLSANFVQSEYQITVSASPLDGGQVSGEGTFEDGSEVTVVATPNENEDWEFVNWTENSQIVSEDSEYSFIITQDRELVANFTKEFFITVTHTDGGDVIFPDSPSFLSYPDLKGIWDIEITWHVKEINGFPDTFVMLVERQKSGEFTGVVELEGSVPDIPVTGTVEENGDIEFSFVVESPGVFIPDYHFFFMGSVSGNIMTGNCEMYEDEKSKVPDKEGLFEAKKRQTLLATVDYGNNITMEMQPDEYYIVDEIFVDWVSAGASSIYTFENVEQNHYFHAKFKLQSYTITAIAGEGGSISPSGEVQVQHGEDQTFTITPDEDYAIYNLIVDGTYVDVKPTYTFKNVTSNHTIEAQFISTYTIDASCSEGGTINPSGEITVFHGWGQSFSITPDEGYSVNDVLVDGVSVGPKVSYVFSNVTTDHTIYAYFKGSPPQYKWQKNYGGTEDEWTNQIQQTSDNGYIVFGTTFSNNHDVSGNHGNSDAWIIKLSSTGTLVWQNCIGGNNIDGGCSIQQTADNKYIVAGNTFSSSISDSPENEYYQEDVIYSDAWIAKLNSSGGIIWEKRFGGSSGDSGRSIIQTNDNGFLLLGDTSSTDGDISGNNGGHDIWVLKLDSSGAIEWKDCFGGSGDEFGFSVQQTSDNGYIIAGKTDSNNGDVSGTHDTLWGDMWVIKLDSDGNLDWQKTLGGSYEDCALSIRQTSDNGYIVAGYTNSSDGDVTGKHSYQDMWIVKLSSSGAIEWQKALGGNSEESASSVIQTTDGSYLIAGTTYSDDGDVTGKHNGSDLWLVKLDPSGMIKWEGCFGGSNNDGASSIEQTADGGYIVSGYSYSDDGDLTDNNGGEDFWVIRLNSD